MRVVTERSAFRETAAAAPADARVPVEIRVRVADPFEAYAARRWIGLQFRPESILTDAGERTVAAFCERCSTT